ncbi:hypothetical protein [Sphingomonas sp. PR090111-T3T-6A]|uniref:hypothetical protein n=1 Tax=Sphingomonas sp. PR090111-T3T-6A TaxID=685778 RepID=UPI00037F3077|nr:hypothetical protein [Sphingomonas sp. PR090111-T3T-6A]
MTEWERTALSQAIRKTVISQGNYSSIVRETAVRQPVVSQALHRRLVVRTQAVDRLFEYLLPNSSPSPASDQDDKSAADEDALRRRERLIGMLDRLSDGSDEADDRLASILAALGVFAGPGIDQQQG